MANRNFDPIKGLTKHIRVIAGSFAPAGTGAPGTLRGIGWSVARSAAGRFTVTLEDTYDSLISGVATVQLAGNTTDLYAQLGAVDVASARTVIIRTMTAAVETDIAADANNRVNFVLFLKNSAVTP